MKKFLVTIVLITGYHFDSNAGEYDLDQPKFKYVDFEVEAETEDGAIKIAKEKETSHHSIWESYTTEID